jgi:hypothetical protein
MSRIEIRGKKRSSSKGMPFSMLQDEMDKLIPGHDPTSIVTLVFDGYPDENGMVGTRGLDINWIGNRLSFVFSSGDYCHPFLRFSWISGVFVPGSPTIKGRKDDSSITDISGFILLVSGRIVGVSILQQVRPDATDSNTIVGSMRFENGPVSQFVARLVT